MAVLGINYVFPIVGPATNNQVRESFDDIVNYFAPIELTTTLLDLSAVNITTTGLGTFGNLDVDTLNLNGNSITDSTGTILFDDENLTTTGIITGGSFSTSGTISAGDITATSITLGTLIISDGSIDDTDGSITFGDTNLITTGKISSDDLASTGIVTNVDSSPAQITGDQNDYAPGDVSVLRLSTDASRTITGFSGGSQGRLLQVINAGSNDLTLDNQSASSTAANRIITGLGADIVLNASHSIQLFYDSTTSRWRIINSNAAFWS